MSVEKRHRGEQRFTREEFIEQVLFVYPSGRCDEVLSQIGIRKLTKEELLWKTLLEPLEPLRLIASCRSFMHETVRCVR